MPEDIKKRVLFSLITDSLMFIALFMTCIASFIQGKKQLVESYIFLATISLANIVNMACIFNGRFNKRNWDLAVKIKGISIAICLSRFLYSLNDILISN